MNDKTRLNIEVSTNLQKQIKNHAINNNTSIKTFLTDLITEELRSPGSKKKKSTTDVISDVRVTDFDKLFNMSQKNSDDDIFRVAIICGGPSTERGISLNSARSAMDHLTRDGIEVVPFFVDQNKNAYAISTAQLYSNTPSDFDFKLKQSAIPLNQADFLDRLKEVDIVFPLVHGRYGEDGELQYLLEQSNIPFVGSGSYACRSAFNKYRSSELLRRNGFYIFPSIVLRDGSENNKKRIKRFFDLNNLKKAIIKPVNGGSSIGVYCIYSYVEAIEKMKLLFSKGSRYVILEPFCVGREFTTIILQNSKQESVALLPSEIEMKYENYQIFDYRRKYLPSVQTRYYTPARFNDEEIFRIQEHIEEVFKLFDLKDIIRIDGWLLNDGRIWFSDFNIASGMEQNSFVFQQATKLGLSHSDMLYYILKNSCKRQNIEFPEIKKTKTKRKHVRVLFGGSNAERQVSLMSGTNVWLKLRNSKKYDASPYLLDKKGYIWSLPYAYTLNHTVEEIYENCVKAEENNAKITRLSKDVCKKLGIKEFKPELPRRMTFEQFIKEAKKENAFVFLGLHGGEGEDGTIQKRLDKAGLMYNGSRAEGSSLGMDKYETGKVISAMKDKVARSAPKVKFGISDFDKFEKTDYEKFWNKVKKDLNSSSFIIKPGQDGCSAGIVRIYDHNDLQTYVDLINDNAPYIPVNIFKNQSNIIEMPSNKCQDFLLEAFIETDDLSIKKGKMHYTKKTGWLELTVGVIEHKGKYCSFNPSITIAEGEVLSVEEKFQGGTGINITPPPMKIFSKQIIENCKKAIERVAKAMKIKNYARIDIFLNTDTGKMIILEANTLPALTPSTVIYHQALAENPTIYPTEFLEMLMDMRCKEGK